jgi:hypothetical protein
MGHKAGNFKIFIIDQLLTTETEGETKINNILIGL